MKRRHNPLDETRAAEIREESDLAAEFEAHVEHRTDDLVAEGLTEDAARAQARAELGDVPRYKAASLAVRHRARRRAARASKLDALAQDFRYSLRQLRRRPGFALTALATLMLGVGSAATIVSVVDAVVLEPLPFEDPDRLVFPQMRTPEGAPFSVSEPVLLDWRAQARSFEDMAGYFRWGATQRSPGEPRSIVLAVVSHSILDVLGLEPVLGRMFTAEEDQPDEALVALLSYDAWQSEYAGSPDVLGTMIDLDGQLHEVIGVMPDELELLTTTTPLFVPMGPDPDMDREEHYLTVVARLADDATVAMALTDLTEVQAGLEATYGADVGWGVGVDTSAYTLIGDNTVAAGWILLTAAGLLLVMACVNVSNLLMVRATVRRAEMGLRTALGASRVRLVRQLFTESAILAAIGGALGLLFAYLALPTVKALGEARIPRLDTAALDGTALLACVVSVAGAALLCGLAPVVQLRTKVLGVSIGSSHRGSSDPGSRLRSAFVGAQVAMTVVLLAGTGLLFRSFLALTAVDPGFEAEGTLAVRLDMPDNSFTWQERGDLMPLILEAVESLPGVQHVGATAVDPFSGLSLANFVARVDQMPDRAADFTPIAWRVVTPGFFEAMGMELKAGRAFEDSDRWDGLLSIVIGENLARSLYGNESPIDRIMVWGDPDGSRMRVVGVVEDLRDVQLAEEARPIVYRPHRQIPWAVMVLVARVQGEPTTVAAGIRERIQEAVPGLPVPEIRSLEQNLHQAVAQPRFNLQLLSGFAGLGLLMAIIGVYGLTSFDVRRRFREIGIRLSLGAEPDDVRLMIVRQRMALTGLGAAAGVAIAIGLTRLIGSQLYGITPNDPLTWVGVVTVVGVASTLAAYVPARRATQVDPRVVLNGE